MEKSCSVGDGGDGGSRIETELLALRKTELSSTESEVCCLGELQLEGVDGIDGTDWGEGGESGWCCGTWDFWEAMSSRGEALRRASRFACLIRAVSQSLLKLSSRTCSSGVNFLILDLERDRELELESAVDLLVWYWDLPLVVVLDFIVGYRAQDR